MSKNNKIVAAVVVVVAVAALVFLVSRSSQGSTSSGAQQASNALSDQSQVTPPTSNETSSSGAFIMKTDSKGGSYVADSKGMALYTFDKDTPGVSNCIGQCLQNWPPYTATQTDNLPSGYGVITRSDGTKQYTLNQMPLYYYIKDTDPNDTYGDGVGGIWHLAK